MKRILGAVVALAAVLAFGTVSHAAPVTYDLLGSVLQTGSALAPPPGYFTSPFNSGSLTINPDTNGDGILGQANDVSLVSGTWHIAGTTTIPTYGTITTDTTTVLTGGTGTLTGTSLLWNADTGVATTGTVGCTGLVCSLLGISPLPAVSDISAYYNALIAQGVTFLNPISLGTMNFTSTGLDTILPGGISVASVATPTGGTLGPASWYIFHGVPEPSTFALMLLGLGGLALRSRKA
jgi:hypothetical protein